MERLEFINYKGKEILYINHSGLNEDELIENMKRSIPFIMNYKGDEILILVDFTDTFGTEKVMRQLKSKESLDVMKKVKKTAVLGVVGIKRIFLNVYNKLTGENSKAFNTLEEAKEYLITE